LYPPADEEYEADRTLTIDSTLEKPHSATFSTGKHRRISKHLQIPLLIWVSVLDGNCNFKFLTDRRLVSLRYIVSRARAIFDVSQSNFILRLTMADGVFTPAVSVTSAVGGIAVAKPSVTKEIIPISIVINS